MRSAQIGFTLAILWEWLLLELGDRLQFSSVCRLLALSNQSMQKERSNNPHSWVLKVIVRVPDGNR
ncbi:MAG: hypothetical protein AAF984_11580 [Verrucomicrobiota bacterium]